VFAKAEALTTTPKISAAHYVLEIGITAKGDMALGIQWAVRIAYNDAHSGGNGLQMWPPASTNTNPATWGYVDYSMSDNPTADVPEGFGFIAIAALTTVAVVAGAFFLRKRQVTRIVPTKTIV
jgi:hypothetical protein